MYNNYIFVTSALPYSNGYLHLGHILEFIQTDIWVRYKREVGFKCFYFSGIDAHGTPIMLKAQNEHISPETLINRYYLAYKKDLFNFNINCNSFYSTHSYENEMISKKFFLKLYEKKFIFIKEIYQFYDFNLNVFLPDRYVIGKCPKCFALNQYGDICSKCCASYNAFDLIDPLSKLSGVKPEKKQTKHFFFHLNKFNSFLKKWFNISLSQKQISNKLLEWFNSGLVSWDISRDFPYFGIKIPGEFNKFFYVWLDAPIGYISSIQNFFLKYNINIFNYNVFNLYHFIGKDIIYFHALFWPAILKGVDFILPKKILVHGFLTVNGFKMSKSNNTFILANDFIKQFNAEYLRFYLAYKLNNNIVDIDFNFLDFCNKINSNLISKFLNIISRTSKIIINNYNYMLSSKLNESNLFNDYLNLNKIIMIYYDTLNYSGIIRLIMKYSDKINIYIDNHKPWKLCKDSVTYRMGQEVCTTAINLFLILLMFLKPIMPKLVDNIQCMFVDFRFYGIVLKKPVLNIKIEKYKHVASRIHDLKK